MDSSLSPVSLNDDDDSVRIVTLNEQPEGTTDNFLDLQNTQYVLEVEPAPPKCNKGKPLLSHKRRQINTMKKHPLWLWFENSWQSDLTIRLMKPWLTLLSKKALETKNMKLYHVVRVITKIMKDFIYFLKVNKKPLINCGFASFEEWACEDGLSTMYGKLHTMHWEKDFNEQLFVHYSEAFMEMERSQAEMDEAEEPEYSLSRNMKDTCMSSTIAPTVYPTVVASTSRDLESTQPKKIVMMNTPGKKVRRALFQREKSPSRKRKQISSDEEEEIYKQGTLFKEAQRMKESQASVEDESKPDVDIKINITSPFRDRVKLSKNQYWTKSTSRSLACVQDGDGTENSDYQRHYADKGSKNREKKSNRMEEWLDTFIITPIKNIPYTGHWINGPYRYVPKNKQILSTCFHNIQQRIVDMSYRELFLKTRVISMNKLIYVAPWNKVFEYYYDVYDSVAVLEDLLKHQFNNDNHDVYNFLKNLYYLVDKKVRKKNCICIIGPSCAGKNFFFDCFIHSCINFGQIGNFNKYDRFPLQDALQRRIILWTGSNFEPGSEEILILKLLSGGDTCSARIKYEGDARIFRTPMVVLTNRDVIPNDTSFTSRVWKYQWRIAPFLKYLTKKPHPLSMFYLFFKYNILSRNNFKFDKWENDII